MTRTNVMVALLKEKPTAIKTKESTDTVFKYSTECSLGSINFTVPVSDMGEKEFEEEVPAQLLNRWIIVN